jgi:soluble lytic murein transglycosylase
VAASAQEQAVDPWLLLALVRQESAYRPTALSSAGARGLTQVMPGTAAGIAEGLGLPAFGESQLDRPAIALRFGAVYLRSTLQQFDGNVLYALAAYNAGPGPIPGWTGGAVGDDPDLFIDNIPYAETREYVQIVYTNWAIYRRLYPQGP